MNKATALKIWHLTGLGATILAGVAAELTPIVKNYPKVAVFIGGVSVISLGITSAINYLNSDKVFRALINDPSSPTPQGFGLPTPVATPEFTQAVQAGNSIPAVVQAVAAAAVAQNVIDHANAVLAATPDQKA